MSSNINAAVPPFGNPTTAGVRANFLAAKNEIEAMQTAFGYVDYADAETLITPLSLTANVWRKLTNDTLGPFTKTSRLPAGVTSIWNPATDQFDFTDLPVNSTVRLRAHLYLTTAVNNLTADLVLSLGIGSASAFELPIISHSYFKNATEHRVAAFTGFYIGSNDIKNNPTEIRMRIDGAGSVKVIGWYAEIQLPTWS
jgi:hypothetical protein